MGYTISNCKNCGHGTYWAGGKLKGELRHINGGVYCRAMKSEHLGCNCCNAERKK